MKRFIITIALFITLIGSVFATDWRKVGTFESKVAGQYTVYYDVDATKPFENEDFKYLKYLKDNYKKVEVTVFDANGTENNWFVDAAKKSCYATLEIYEGYVIEDHVNKDGSVTEYICWR